MRVFTERAEVFSAVGEELGTSPWIVVEQERIDAFADATEDHQWLHVDPARAAAGPFGSTIAHGYLTLSLLSLMSTQNYRFDGARMSVNYGLNRVRFIKPVPVGSRLRAISTLTEAQLATDGSLQMTFHHVVERDGSDAPVCVADSLSRIYF